MKIPVTNDEAAKALLFHIWECVEKYKNDLGKSPEFLYMDKEYLTNLLLFMGESKKLTQPGLEFFGIQVIVITDNMKFY